MGTKRKVCVVTGSRAEYGLLYWVMHNIQESLALDLYVVVTGMHLSPEFGLTYKKIEEDGFEISRKVEMLVSSDMPTGVTKSMGLGLIGFGEVFEDLRPDIVVMLGDRFELLSAASASLIHNIPIAHIHGGETTEGAFDEAIRHSITKMAHLHFTSTEIYRSRVIQLGEYPERVFNVGAPGLENIRRLELVDRSDLEDAIGMKLASVNLLVTWHPTTLELGNTQSQFQELLDALKEFENIKLIFTKSNADTEGRVINRMIDEFTKENRHRAVSFASLGQLLYLSAVKHVAGVVGNSSSGIIEAPSLKTGTVNIGDRQRGRVRAASVIDCAVSKMSIVDAIQRLCSAQFQKDALLADNPYGSGDTAGEIVEKLETYPLEGILKKSFFDFSR